MSPIKMAEGRALCCPPSNPYLDTPILFTVLIPDLQSLTYDLNSASNATLLLKPSFGACGF